MQGFPALGRSARSPRCGQARVGVQLSGCGRALPFSCSPSLVSPPRAHALRLPSGPRTGRGTCPTHPAPLRRTAAQRNVLRPFLRASDLLRGASPPVNLRAVLPQGFEQPWSTTTACVGPGSPRQLFARSRTARPSGPRRLAAVPPSLPSCRSALLPHSAAPGRDTTPDGRCVATRLRFGGNSAARSPCPHTRHSTSPQCSETCCARFAALQACNVALSSRAIPQLRLVAPYHFAGTRHEPLRGSLRDPAPFRVLPSSAFFAATTQNSAAEKRAAPVSQRC